jgi:hypothetical protein
MVSLPVVNIVTAGRVGADGTEVRDDLPVRLLSSHVPCPARSSPSVDGQIHLKTALADVCVISSHTGTGAKSIISVYRIPVSVSSQMATVTA